MKTIKEWYAKAGIRNIGYLIGGVACYWLFGWGIILGVGITLFVIDNWLVIKNLLNKKADS